MENVSNVDAGDDDNIVDIVDGRQPEEDNRKILEILERKMTICYLRRQKRRRQYLQTVNLHSKLT